MTPDPIGYPSTAAEAIARLGIQLDPEDLPRLTGAKIYIKNGYPMADLPNSEVRLHRLILELEPGQIGDHINGKLLDNRKVNLRLANIFVSNQNRWHRVLGRGVSWNGRCWVARVQAKFKLYVAEAQTLIEAVIVAELLRKEYTPDASGADITTLFGKETVARYALSSNRIRMYSCRPKGAPQPPLNSAWFACGAIGHATPRSTKPSPDVLLAMVIDEVTSQGRRVVVESESEDVPPLARRAWISGCGDGESGYLEIVTDRRDGLDTTKHITFTPESQHSDVTSGCDSLICGCCDTQTALRAS